MRRPLLLTTVAACVLTSMTLGADAKSGVKPFKVAESSKSNISTPGGDPRPAPEPAKPEPATGKPEPTTVTPDPATAKPEPTPVKPEAVAAKPAPTTPTPTADRLASALDGFGLGLLETLATAKNASPNTVVSPASAASVLSLLDLGASADMRQALHKTLGLKVDKADATADLEALRGIIAPLMAGQENSPLSGASALLFDPSSPPFPLAVMGLKAAGAEVTTEKLSDPAILTRVNDFVSKATKGLIPTILDKAPDGAGLIALNALHFKDKWEQQFDAGKTKDAPFTLVDKKTVTVPMMNADAQSALFKADDKFVAVQLHYVTKGYSLVLVTTKSGPAPMKDFRPALAMLSGAGFKPASVKLSLPRFSLAGSVDILAGLDKLGLKPARLNSKSLSGLSPAPQNLAEVAQKTVIKLTEEGTEAAAATVAQTTRDIGAGGAQTVAFDHPFMFALQHDSGLVLMTGYVGDPSKAE